MSKKVLDILYQIGYNAGMRKKTTIPNTAGRKAAQKKYNSTPEQKKRRAERGRTRYKLEKMGLVHKGDGKDVDHKNHRTGDMRMSNLGIESKYKNRKDGGPGALKKKRTSVPKKRK